jgi:hypothetical protein
MLPPRGLRDPVWWFSVVQIAAALANIYERKVWLLWLVVACSAAIGFIVVRRMLRTRREVLEWRTAMRRSANAWKN